MSDEAADTTDGPDGAQKTSPMVMEVSTPAIQALTLDEVDPMYDPPRPGSRLEELQAWFLSCDEEDARKFLKQTRTRWEPLVGYSEPNTRTPRTVVSIDENDGVQIRRQIVRNDTMAAMKEFPIVQLSTAMYFCRETEGELVVDVVRIGNCEMKSIVHYTTTDGSAKAGDKYYTKAGILEFEPGENEKNIKIFLKASAVWETTTEFFIELLQEGSEKCMLGRYLYSARIKVIDTFQFPTNKFNKVIQTDRRGSENLQERLHKSIRHVPGWSFFFEYVKWNLNNKTVWRGTVKTFLCDLYCALYTLVRLLINVYLVDDVLQNKRLILPDQQEMTLIVIAIILTAPQFGVHYFEFRQLCWKISGNTRGELQKSLLRKFLHFSEESRSEIDRGELVMAMTRDAGYLTMAYLSMLKLSRFIGSLLAILLFQVLVVPVFDASPNVLMFTMSFIFPIILFVFLHVRRQLTSDTMIAKNGAEDAFVGQVDRTVTNYDIISDYNQRPMFVERQEERITDLNYHTTAEAQVLKNNSWCSKWLTTSFFSIYVVYGAFNVMKNDGEVTLGMYLANLQVILQIGDVWGQIYETMMECERQFPALVNIATVLNLPTDVPARLDLNRARRHRTVELRASLQQKAKAENTVPLDLMPIEVNNVEYNLKVSNHGVDQTLHRCMIKGRMEIPQGCLVGLVGARAGGKTTLLKLLAGALLPTKPGCVFVPSHLRVLHVSPDPLFYKGNLYDNLKFGVTKPGDPDGSMERVLKICSAFGLSARVLDLIKDTSLVDVVWSTVLTATEKHLCLLARALIANFEILCLHKPTQQFGIETAERVIRMLRTFVDEKGVEQDHKTRHLRRCRTCVFTTARKIGFTACDLIFEVENREMRMISADDVTPSMLA